MPIAVRPVQSRRERRAFLELPQALHAGDPIRTPPLAADFARNLSPKNPLWERGRGEYELFVAYDGAEPVGRVMAHVHHASNARHGERAGFFGSFECPDDVRVAQALLDAVEEAHRRRGLSLLRGPYDLTITQCIGAVTHGFDEPACFAQSWNAPHVPVLLEALGFAAVYRASTFRLDDVDACNPEGLLGDKHRAWLANPRVRVRPWNMARFDDDVRAATALLNASFAENFGFVPMCPAEVDFMAGPMRRVVRPELTVFLELDDEPVGVGMVLPDFHVLFRRMGGNLWPLGWATFLLGRRAVDAAVGQFIATSPAHQNLGVMRVVLSELIRRLQRARFRSLDATWVGESNAKSRAQMTALGMREKHRLALYARQLT